MSRIESIDKEKTFFYAMELAAGMYDDTIELVVPQYKLMHAMMLELLRYHFRVPAEGSTDTARTDLARRLVTGTILDIGSGTGKESLAVLKLYPGLRVVAFDLCGDMHKEFRKNFDKEFPGTDINSRCSLIEGDIANGAGAGENLRSYLPESEREQGYKAVITAFTIHHLPSQEKAEVYQRIYTALEPGGIMINGDLFSYQSGTLSVSADDFDKRWITAHFKEPSGEFPQAMAMSEEKREDLRRAWISHYCEDNILAPMEAAEAGEDACSYPSKAQIGQTEMLRAAGFRQNGCPFRYWQVGILWARK